MADTLFIKATASCGYDKADVDKRLETLYSTIYNLKNEIRENKQIIKKYEDGCSQDKAYENALAVERAQLTQLQVKNENLSEKNKARAEEIRIKEQENVKLQEEVTALKEEVEELRLKQMTLQNNDTEDLGMIFIEAKKSRDLIINNAKQEASLYMDEAKKFAEDLIAETNANIEQLIENAKKKAADIIAEAEANKVKLESDKAALREQFLDNIRNVDEEIKKMKAAVENFNSNTLVLISNSEDIINSAHNKLGKMEEESLNKSSENTEINTVSPPPTENPETEQEVNDIPMPSTKNESGINLDDLLKQANELNKI